MVISHHKRRKYGAKCEKDKKNKDITVYLLPF